MSCINTFFTVVLNFFLWVEILNFMSMDFTKIIIKKIYSKDIDL